MIRTLIKFGYSNDKRLRKVIDWLPKNQLENSGWNCDHPEKKVKHSSFIPIVATPTIVGSGAQFNCYCHNADPMESGTLRATRTEKATTTSAVKAEKRLWGLKRLGKPNKVDHPQRLPGPDPDLRH